MSSICEGMKRLSIIIPMYNVEYYVERCLRSLEDQDIDRDDYEIICINDGSPDNCSRVVRNLQEEFGNIHLLEQENQGVSRARNNGIEFACGRYLLFIDPDDYVDSNSLSGILKTAEEKEAQVLFLGFTILTQEGTIRNKIFNELATDIIYQGTEVYFVSRGDGRTDPDRMWAILFQTDFMNKNNLRYLAEVPYLEDGEFIARILCLAERCAFYGHSFYQRTTRSGSATNSKLFNSDNATMGFLLAASNLRAFQKGSDLNEKQRVFLNQPIVKFTLLAVNSSISRRINGKLKKTFRRLDQLSLGGVEVKGCDWEYRICGTAYNWSPWLGALATVLYSRIDRLYQKIIK
jgi:glycosyltransferase involved in cell wall biosynthesis